VLRLVAQEGLLKGGTIAVDATTLEANAALRSIVRPDTDERHEVECARLCFLVSRTIILSFPLY
jgi:transposase